MGLLYQALYWAKARSGWTMLSSIELLDLALHSDFLSYAKQGVSLNIISFRKPISTNQMPASSVQAVIILFLVEPGAGKYLYICDYAHPSTHLNSWPLC
jgi:hypothetical protein